MFRIWTNRNAIRNPNQIAFLFLVSATMLQCGSEVFRGGNPEQSRNFWWHQSSNSVVICSFSTHGSHGNSQYFDPDLPSGNLLHSYWKLQFSSLIYPLIAWWFSSLLCKRLPEGMSSFAEGWTFCDIEAPWILRHNLWPMNLHKVTVAANGKMNMLTCGK